MSLNLFELGLAMCAGGGVGFLSGVFGVGGGFLIVPVLSILLGLPMELAVGAGACQMLGPATTSLVARRVRAEQLRLPLMIAGGLLIGVLFGAEALESAKAAGEVTIRGRAVPAAELSVLVIYLVILLGLGSFFLWEVRRGAGTKTGWSAPLARWPIGPTAVFPEYGGRRLSIAIIAWFGLLVGFLSGMLGIGGGIVLLPGLIYLLGLPTRQAITSSLAIVWITAAQATVVHAWLGNVDLGLVAALLSGGTAGARLGSELSARLGGQQLRRGFGWLLLAAAALIAAKLAVQFGS